MASTFIARAGICLGAGIFLIGIASAQSDAPSDVPSVAREQRELQTAKVQAAAAEARAKVLEDKAAAESNEADQARAQSAAVAARIQSAEADITAAEARIRLIERLRSEQRQRLAAKQEPAVRLVAALQMMARRPPALALVQPGSTTDLVHVRSIMATLLPVIRARTAGLRADIAEGKKLRADADRALAILAAGQKVLEGKRAELVQLAAVHRQASTRLTSTAMVEQDRAIALGEKARDIVDLIDQLGVAAATREELESLPGPLLRPARPGDAQISPVADVQSGSAAPPYRLPVAGTLVTGLGEVSRSGVRARGLTIATRGSAQVVAPTSGRIVFAAPYRGFGRIVIIDHGRGWTTLITSLAALDVRVGDNVVQGSPIGRTAPERPTVTVELRKGSQPVDITPLIG
jgi:murein hydrolase activator